jgi:hypothetical protein
MCSRAWACVRGRACVNCWSLTRMDCKCTYYGSSVVLVHLLMQQLVGVP